MVVHSNEMLAGATNHRSDSGDELLVFFSLEVQRQMQGPRCDSCGNLNEESQPPRDIQTPYGAL